MSDAAVIHPTAIVDPRAALGPRVQVGAFSVIGPDVELGPDVEVGHHAVLEGPVVVGARARIGHGSLLGGVPQDLKYKPTTRSGVRIGAETTIREYVTIHRATRDEGWTEVGEQCLLMGMCHVAHDCRLGNGVIVINYAGLTGHVEVGDRVTIGGLVGIVPYSRIGRFAYIGGMTKVSSDVPPFMLVNGSPATARGVNVIGLRRGGMDPVDRRRLQDAYRIFYRSGLAPARALETIRETLPLTPSLTELVDFIAASRRGVCGPPPRGAHATEPDERESVR